MTKNRIVQVGAGCVACGNCAKNCPFTAITVFRGLHAKVNAAICKGCGKCKNACPAGVVEYKESEAVPA